jgi:putative colanic acid biosynthesis UDP-glucose lipid carrier transferase
MSIVGPRPHMLNDCKEFSRLIKDYDSRSLVKPGITGMAQVKGYRGHVNDLYDAVHRYKWDMFYVKNLNFMLDINIMKQTFLSMMTSTVKGLKPAKKQQGKISYNLDSTEILN